MKNSITYPKVAIMMSTYNGASFLHDQLNSIFAQKEINGTLFIRDDGSTDETISILNEFKKNNDIYIIPFDGNSGPGLSFMKLLYYVCENFKPFDYYAFADQDDIWLENKIKVAIEMLKAEKALLYGSNQWLYENEMKKELRYSHIPDLSLEGHISKNEISGCTMVFSRELASKIISFKIPPKSILDYRMHDAWVFLIAVLYGDVIYDSNSYILYRIHDSNVVGVNQDSLLKKIKFITGKEKGKTRYLNLRSNTARLLLENYFDFKLEDKELLELVAYYNVSIKNKFKLIKSNLIYRKSDEPKFVFILKVIFNIL